MFSVLFPIYLWYSLRKCSFYLLLLSSLNDPSESFPYILGINSLILIVKYLGVSVIQILDISSSVQKIELFNDVMISHWHCSALPLKHHIQLLQRTSLSGDDKESQPQVV